MWFWNSQTVCPSVSGIVFELLSEARGNGSKHYPWHRGTTVWLFQNHILNNCFIIWAIKEKRNKSMSKVRFCKYVNNLTFSILQLWCHSVHRKQLKLLTGQQFKGNTLWHQNTLRKQTKLQTCRQFKWNTLWRQSTLGKQTKLQTCQQFEGNTLWRQSTLGKQTKLQTGQQFKGNTLWHQSTLGKQSKLLTGQQFAFVDLFRISENSKKYQITFIQLYRVSGNKT